MKLHLVPTKDSDAHDLDVSCKCGTTEAPRSYYNLIEHRRFDGQTGDFEFRSIDLQKRIK